MGQKAKKIKNDFKRLTPNKYENEALFNKAFIKFENISQNRVQMHRYVDQKKKCKRMALNVINNDPNHIEALNLLARISLEDQEINSAKSYLQKALKIKPNSPSNLFTYGNLLLTNKKYDSAIEYYEKALEQSPISDQIYSAIGFCYIKQGNYYSAYLVFRNLLNSSFPKKEYMPYLTLALKKIKILYYDEQLESDLKILLASEYINFDDLSGICAQLIEKKYQLDSNSEQLYSLEKIIIDDFFISCLEKIVFNCPTVEKFLASIRNQIFNVVFNLMTIPDELNSLIIGLCVYFDKVDFIVAIKLEEQKQIDQLLTEIRIWPPKKTENIYHYVLIFSMFNHFHQVIKQLSTTVQDFTKLSINGKYKKFIDLIIKPYMELQEIKKYVRQNDLIEKENYSVMSQYNKYPYPKWSQVGAIQQGSYISALINHLPYIKLVLQRQFLVHSVLVAGCGTGKHSLQIALTYPNIGIKGIDLSFNSICYAQKKLLEYKVKNLTYEHGDLLKYESQTGFDIVESSGVIHHLNDPEQGLQKLAQLTKSGGLIKLGLYSERARKPIEEIRNRILQNNLALPTLENIRKVREKILSGRWGAEVLGVCNTIDFYTLSGVVDLLFNVQEIYFTPLRLKILLESNNLLFLGFINLSAKVVSSYLKQFPKDKFLISLDNWDKYELNNPEVFSGMYQFYCKKHS